MYRVALAALMLAGAANADDAPLHFHHRGVTVFLHSRVKTINLAVGDNDVDTPQPFTCESASGCVVVMQASVHVIANSDLTTTCSFVDGVSGIPECEYDLNAFGNDSFTVRQQANVAAGPHMIQTKVKARLDGDQLISWSLEYTVYERGVHGTDEP